MTRRILAPLDGSSFGEQILPLAVGLASVSGAEVELVEVFQQYGHARAEDEAAYLDLMASQLGRRSKIKASQTLLEGAVVDKLVEHIEKTQPDYVAITTHGRGAIARACLGSVATQLIKKLSIPIFLMKPKNVEPFPDLNAPIVPKRILAAFEGSESIQPRLDLISEWAKLLNASVTLFRAVVPPQYLASETMWIHMETVEEEMSATVTAIRDELEQAAELLRSRGIEVDVKVVVQFNPASAILNEVAHSNHDLIAMGTHGRHGFARILMGSIADQVVHHANVPILIDRAYSKSPEALAESTEHQNAIADTP